MNGESFRLIPFTCLKYFLIITGEVCHTLSVLGMKMCRFDERGIIN